MKCFNSIKNVLGEFKPKYIVLDCDGTLYPNVLAGRIEFEKLLYKYLSEKFGFNENEVKNFIADIKSKYNTESEIGACIREGINPGELYHKTLDIIPEKILGLEKAEKWNELSLTEEIKIIVFTNNYAEFAKKICGRLGILGGVEEIFGEVELGFERKPDSSTFNKIKKIVGEDKTIYFDDDLKCLEIGKQYNWITIMPVYNNGKIEKYAHVDAYFIL